MQRYFAKEKVGNQIFLNSDDLYHIKTVMRMNEKNQIQVVYDDKVYLCCLENVKSDIQIFIKNELEIYKNNLPQITLIIPLLKEQKMDLILQKSTELGVSKIIPIITERSIIKVKQGEEQKKLERWKRICKEASEQSYRIDIPEICDIHTISELSKLDGLNLVCNTTEHEKNIRFVLNSNFPCDKINIAIGPEGGFSSKEEKLFEEVGFASISLGNRILRVETVPMYVLSVLNYIYME